MRHWFFKRRIADRQEAMAVNLQLRVDGQSTGNQEEEAYKLVYASTDAKACKARSERENNFLIEDVEGLW